MRQGQIKCVSRDGLGRHAGEYLPHGLLRLRWLDAFCQPEVS